MWEEKFNNPDKPVCFGRDQCLQLKVFRTCECPLQLGLRMILGNNPGSPRSRMLGMVFPLGI